MAISMSSVNKIFPAREMRCVMKEIDGDGHPQFEIRKREMEMDIPNLKFENPFHKQGREKEI